MLDIPDLGVDPDLHPRGRLVRLSFLCCSGRLGVSDRGFKVEDAAHGDGVVEGAGVEGEESGAGVGEGGGGAEGELEGRFEEVAAEDHEVVPVAILGLHDLRGGEGSSGHVVGVWGFAEGVVGV